MMMFAALLSTVEPLIIVVVELLKPSQYLLVIDNLFVIFGIFNDDPVNSSFLAAIQNRSCMVIGSENASWRGRIQKADPRRCLRRHCNNSAPVCRGQGPMGHSKTFSGYLIRPNSFMITSYSTIFFFTNARDSSGPMYSVLNPFWSIFF